MACAPSIYIRSVKTSHLVTYLVELTRNGQALIVTLLFRLMFGGYLVGLDQFLYNDVESALSVIMIYGLLGLFAALFLSGKRSGLTGILGLSLVLLIIMSIYDIVALTQIVDVGLHDPRDNLLAWVLMYLFSVLTLVFAVKVYREP